MPGPHTRSDLLAAAVEDNVRWVDAVARSHGVPTTVTGAVWAAGRPTPDGYPEAVTTAAGTGPADVLAALPVHRGPLSVKDSFADVDLSSAGFDVLFEARWLAHRGPGVATGDGDPEDGGGSAEESPDRWHRVEDLPGLRAWRRVWGDPTADSPIRAELLHRDDVVLLLRDRPEAPTACAVATPAEAAVGVSNVVWADGRPGWPILLAALRRLAPGRPVVGYEWGTSLEQALAAGFEVLGPLRVWARPGAPPGV